MYSNQEFAVFLNKEIEQIELASTIQSSIRTLTQVIANLMAPISHSFVHERERTLFCAFFDSTVDSMSWHKTYQNLTVDWNSKK